MDHTDNQNLLKILKQEILELKKKNLILENQNSEILSLYDKTADPSLILDSTGCLLGFNQALLDTYGYDRKQLLHNHIAILHAQPENRDKINTTIQNPSDAPPHEYLHKRQNGSIFPVEIHIRQGNFKGKPVRIVTIKDISKPRTTITALSESEKRFQLAFESSQIGKALSVAKGRFLWVNKRLAEIMGYEVKEFLELDSRDITHPDDIEKGSALVRDLVDGKMPTDAFNLEKRYISKTGDIIWANTTISLMRDENQSPLYTMVEIMDITTWKTSEQTTRQLQNYLSNIINSMPSILVGVDAKGLITQWNKKAEQETSLREIAVKGNSLSHYFPHFKTQLDQVSEIIQTRQARTTNKIQRQSKGEVVFENITIYPLITSGVEGAVIRIDDVTEQVRLEEMMIQSEKMVSVGGLAAGMVHEINNPLAGIIQNTQVLSLRLTKDNPANLQAAQEVGITFDQVKAFMENRNVISQLDMVHKSGIRAASIVENMLSFSRKANKGKSESSLGALMDKTLKLARNDFDTKKNFNFKKIILTKDYAPDLEPISCEPGKIQQVFLNIIKNAADAMHTDAPPSKAPEINIQIFETASHGVVKIKDNGPGMDTDTQQRLFEPFFTTKPPGQGTGLGLSVSYNIIVNDHRGTMDVSSSKGKGSQFTIKLPRSAGQ